MYSLLHPTSGVQGAFNVGSVINYSTDATRKLRGVCFYSEDLWLPKCPLIRENTSTMGAAQV